jgi:parvulin-like peptidyl-prolyl isomerase
MGTFARGELPGELERAVFGLEVGRVSDPVRSPWGWHVLRVETREAARQRPLEEVREEIRARLARGRAAEAQKGYVRELLSRAKVDHEAALSGHPRS